MISFKESIHTWTLFHASKGSVTITNQTLKELKSQDIVAINFVCKAYSKYKGIILNEDVDFNKYLQVSVFLGPICTMLHDNTIVILCQDDAIIKWHYYLSKYGHFKSYIITANFQFEKINEYAGGAFILGFSNINMIKYFGIKNLFSVVIDEIDLVANKAILKKIFGKFKIGLTSRNFYVDPDQKLQWHMLNWANPGCVGKFKDFQEIDNDNFANLRDNYKEWWYRLTWSYCDTFKRPTEEEKANLQSILNNWIEHHKLNVLEITNVSFRKRKYISSHIKDNFHSLKKGRFFKYRGKCDSQQLCNLSINQKVVLEDQDELIQSTSKSFTLREHEQCNPFIAKQKEKVKISLNSLKYEQHLNIVNINLNEIDDLKQELLDNNKTYDRTIVFQNKVNFKSSKEESFSEPELLDYYTDKSSYNLIENVCDIHDSNTNTNSPIIVSNREDTSKVNNSGIDFPVNTIKLSNYERSSHKNNGKEESSFKNNSDILEVDKLLNEVYKLIEKCDNL